MTLDDALELIRLAHVCEQHRLVGVGSRVFIVDCGIKHSLLKPPATIRQVILRDACRSIIDEQDAFSVVPNLARPVSRHAADVASIVHRIAPEARIVDIQCIRENRSQELVASDHTWKALFASLSHILESVSNCGGESVVINISLDSQVPWDPIDPNSAEYNLLRLTFESFVRGLQKQGADVVVAVGNRFDDLDAPPFRHAVGPLAASDSAIVVGSVDRDLNADRLNRAPHNGLPPSLVHAPSGFAPLLEPGPELAGSSFSAAICSGAVACLRQIEKAQRRLPGDRLIFAEMLRGESSRTSIDPGVIVLDGDAAVRWMLDRAPL